MSREEFVRTWSDKWLSAVVRAATMDRAGALFARWLALQVAEVDGWIGALYDALEEEERVREPEGDGEPSRGDKRRRWAARALSVIWANVIEPALAEKRSAAPMDELPEPLRTWLGDPEHRKVVRAVLDELEAKERREAA